MFPDGSPTRSLNPSIQIRAVPTEIYFFRDLAPKPKKSQSLNTDQGSSDGEGAHPRMRLQAGLNPSIQIRAVPTPSNSSRSPTTPPSLNPSIQIRAVPTYGEFELEQPSSIQVSIPQYRSGQFRRFRRPRPGVRHQEVSIPQYRSGQFRLDKELKTIQAKSQESQSLNTDQGSSDLERFIMREGGINKLGLNPSIQIRAVPTTEASGPRSSATKARVSIPQYRSGQFRQVYFPPPCGTGDSVSIPQYRSGQFRRDPAGR